MFEDRLGRATARVLKTRYSNIWKARQLKLSMEISEAAGGGWKTLTTMPHSDRLDFSVIEKYWHLEATSTPDNENKNRVRIIHLEGDTETTTFHTQRYQHETDGVFISEPSRHSGVSSGARTTHCL